MKRTLLAGVIVLACAAQWVTAAETQQYILTLDNAVGGDRPMLLHIDCRDGKVRQAFAQAPRYNKMPYDVDASAVTCDGSTITGTIKVTVRWDGYMPRDGKDLACQYALDAKVGPSGVAGTFTGKFGAADAKGAISGSRVEPVSTTGNLRFVLKMEAAMPGKKAGDVKGRRAGFRFAMQDGRAYGGKVVAPGSMNDISWTGLVREMDLKLEDGRLSGTVKWAYTAQSGEAGDYEWRLDLRVIGDALAGTVATKTGTVELTDGRVLGTVETAPPPPAADAIYTIELRRAIDPKDANPCDRFVRLYFLAAGGKGVHGFAVTPIWNNATHVLDPTDLVVEGGHLKGTARVHINPDPWIPRDHKPVDCTYSIDAAVQGAEVIGTYEGKYGADDARGAVVGEIARVVEVKNMTGLNFKLENGLAGGNPMQNRAFFSMKFEEGRIISSKVSNNHTELHGTIDTSEIAFDGRTLKGAVKANIKPSGGVWGGEYLIRLDAKLLGTTLYGTFETHGKSPAGEPFVKRGALIGGVTAN